jgi:hypothetical protein
VEPASTDAVVSTVETTTVAGETEQAGNESSDAPAPIDGTFQSSALIRERWKEPEYAERVITDAITATNGASPANPVRIDPEFQGLIPPLALEERQQLEDNLRRQGCRDPLAVWDGTLLDGHHRKEICDRLGIDYATAAITLPDRNAAKEWIIRNQFGRRNLTPFQRAELALKLEPLIAARGKEKQRDAGGAVCQKSDKPVVDTKKELAKVAGVSHDTIHKAKVVSKRASEPVKEKLRRGETSIHREYQKLQREEKEREAEKPQEGQNHTAPSTRRSFEKPVEILDCDEGELLSQVKLADMILTELPDGMKPSDFKRFMSDGQSSLAPGGKLAVICRPDQLQMVLSQAPKGLNVLWIMSYCVKPRTIQVTGHVVLSGWKPIVVFGVNDNASFRCATDFIAAGGMRRSQFNRLWVNGSAGLEQLVAGLKYEAVVCDPFLTGPEIAKAVQKKGRRFIGASTDSDQAELIRKKLGLDVDAHTALPGPQTSPLDAADDASDLELSALNDPGMAPNEGRNQETPLHGDGQRGVNS